MSVELILNSVNINFVAFNKYLYADKLDWVFFTIFIITIAAAEAAVAMAIIINLYRHYKSIDVEDADTLKYWAGSMELGEKSISELHAPDSQQIICEPKWLVQHT